MLVFIADISNRVVLEGIWGYKVIGDKWMKDKGSLPVVDWGRCHWGQRVVEQERGLFGSEDSRRNSAWTGSAAAAAAVVVVVVAVAVAAAVAVVGWM